MFLSIATLALLAVCSTLLALCLLPFLFLATALNRLLRAFSAPLSPPVVTDRDCCSIVILNWDGRRLLEEHLPSVVEAVRFDGRPHQILVVDNGSQDDSIAWIRVNLPQVEVLPLPSNRGFGEGNNAGIAACRFDTVVLLNNDMRVERDFLRPLLQGFDADVFAVSSQIFFQDASRPREESGNTFARWRGTRLEMGHGVVGAAHKARRYTPIFWAGGGSSAFDRQKFLALGGFDRLFAPAYAEDADISFRAWKMGWRVLLAPASVVHHRHRATSRKLLSAEKSVNLLLEKNLILFAWANLENVLHLARALCDFPRRVSHLARQDGRSAIGLVVALLAALPGLFERRLRRPATTLAERKVFSLSGSLLEYLDRYAPATRRAAGRLNLLFVSAYIPCLWRHGGAGRVHHLIRRLARHHRVTLLTFLETNEDRDFIPELESFCERVVAIPRRNCFKFQWFAYEPFDEFDLPEMHAAVRELVETEDFDIVHFEWTQMARYARWCRRSVTFLTEIEVNYAAAYTRHGHTSGWLRRIKSKYDWMQVFNRELSLCRKTDHVVCVNETDAEYLRGYLDPRRVHVVETGVDLNFFSVSVNGDEELCRMVFVGAFRHEPNVDAMLYFSREIYPRIRRGNPRAEMYIVGSSPPEPVRQLESLPGITVTGFVEDLTEVYRQSAIVVVPLRTGVGIRGKILEAWAAGKAVVATPLACAGIQAEHGENVIVADDPAQFARWTLALLGNREARRRLGYNARQTAERTYGWDMLADRLEQLYLEVLDSASPQTQ